MIPFYVPKLFSEVYESAELQLSEQPTQVARQLFGEPISTKRKLCGNFLTRLFIKKVDKYRTSTNQNIIKNTMKDLTAKWEFPVTEITIPRK